LREAFPYDTAPSYLIFDRGTQFNEEVIETMKSFGIRPKQTSFLSPWQNGVAERWVGNCRRDLLDHVIVLNERHLKRLMNEYAVIITRTELISRWQRERLPVVRQRVMPVREVMSQRCRGSAACIIATISRPEFLVLTIPLRS
jgi:hypothetical protein